MAVPNSGEITVYGIAKEMELDNYDNTIPISTYRSYYATPVSLTNMSTGAGGFDAINTSNDAADRPDGALPHSASEFYSYDHDYDPFTFDYSVWDFNAQTGSSGAIWSPNGTHSGWDNGASCVDGSQWEAGDPGSQRDWYLDNNTTASPNTGPAGSCTNTGGHITSGHYIYSEVSSPHTNKYHICRTPGVNYYAAMTGTNWNLYIWLWEHSFGVSMGKLRVYVDNAPTSNHANATLLLTRTGATNTSSSQSWAAVINLPANQMRTDEEWYIYFVSSGASGYRGDRAIDRIGVVESNPHP